MKKILVSGMVLFVVLLFAGIPERNANAQMPIMNAGAPTIDTQPQPVSVMRGLYAGLFVRVSTRDVTGRSTLTYQWYRNKSNSTVGGTAIQGANGSSYTLNTETAGETWYYVIITNTNNDVAGTKTASTTSAVVSVRVTAATSMVWRMADANVIDIFDYYGIHKIAYGGGRFIAVNNGANWARLAYSDDGLTWTSVSAGPFVRDCHTLAWGGGRFVAALKAGSDSSLPEMAYSNDGIVWTKTDISKLLSDYRYNTRSWTVSIAYGNGYFAAIFRRSGDNLSSSRVAYSNDGVQWVLVNQNFGNDAPSQIVYGNNRFVASGGGNIWYSNQDGSWTRTSEASGSIAYGGGRFIVRRVGYLSGGRTSKQLLYSSDGAHWSSVAGNFPTGAIAYGGGRFVAGDDGGKIQYSVDGLNWHILTNTEGKEVTIGYYRTGTYKDGYGYLYSNPGIVNIVYGNNSFVTSSWMVKDSNINCGQIWRCAWGDDEAALSSRNEKGLSDLEKYEKALESLKRAEEKFNNEDYKTTQADAEEAIRRAKMVQTASGSSSASSGASQ